MGAPNAELVEVGVTGGIYLGTDDATLPVDPLSTLDSDDFSELGYADESGVVETQGTQVTNIKAWQFSAVVRKIQTEHDLTYAFTLMETSPEVLEAYYGNFSGSASDGVVEIKGEVAPQLPWVIEVLDGDKKRRIVIPLGQITDKGSVTYGATDAITYPLTLTCFPDTDGVKAYIYTTDAAIESA